MKISSKHAGSNLSLLLIAVNFTFIVSPVFTVYNRDGDLALFNSLLGSADVNHVSESLHGIKLVLPWLLLLGAFSDYVLLAGTLHWVLPSCSTTKK